MCLAFLFYYPKVNVTFCVSQPNYDQLSSVPWHAVQQLNTWDWKDKSVRDNFNGIVDNSTYNYICNGLDKSTNIDVSKQYIKRQRKIPDSLQT